MKSDKELQQDVYEELKWDPKVTITEIGITVKGGIVTLSGAVPHFAEKYAAESASLRVKEVRTVANDIQVRLLSTCRKPDAIIAKALLQALKWHVGSPKNLKISVDNGVVMLKGRATWNYQRAAAEQTVRHLKGVRGVVNQITLTPLARPAEIKASIEKALECNAHVDALGIRVLASGSKVVLSGSVRYRGERDEAEVAACAAPGVSQVDNKLSIKT
jgi:osmotically-inducible protein OsmY